MRYFREKSGPALLWIVHSRQTKRVYNCCFSHLCSVQRPSEQEQGVDFATKNSTGHRNSDVHNSQGAVPPLSNDQFPLNRSPK